MFLWVPTESQDHLFAALLYLTFEPLLQGLCSARAVNVREVRPWLLQNSVGTHCCGHRSEIGKLKMKLELSLLTSRCVGSGRCWRSSFSWSSSIWCGRNPLIPLCPSPECALRSSAALCSISASPLLLQHPPLVPLPTLPLWKISPCVCHVKSSHLFQFRGVPQAPCKYQCHIGIS